MNNESTDKRFIDSDQDKPRIILRGNLVVTTNVTQGSYSTGVNFVDLASIKASVNTLVEVYMKDNQDNKVYSIPILTSNSSGQFVLNAYYYLSSESVDVGGGNFVDVQYIACNALKRGGALTDTYTFFYVIYSTNINEAMDIGFK